MHKIIQNKRHIHKKSKQLYIKRSKIFIQQTYVAKNMKICLYAKFMHITFMGKIIESTFPQNFVTNKSEGEKGCAK